jgi:hypothetical protein
MVHGLLSHVFGGLEVDGEPIVVEKAHSKNNGGDGGMTKEQRNRKALKDFKNGRFGVLVVCEMFVQGADFPELDEVLPWNSNLAQRDGTVQLGGRASRKVEGGSKESYGFQLRIQYLEEEDDDDGDDDGMDNDNGAPTPESFFACLTEDGVQLYTQLAAAFGENVKFIVRYTRKKKDATEGVSGGGSDHMEVDDDDGLVVTTFNEMDITAIREVIGVDRFDGKLVLTDEERSAVYLAEGVTWWVHNEFRGMTNVAATRLTGIFQRSTYTYTTEDGSTITLNMGRDTCNWKRVAKEADESPNRTQKRAWLCAIREVLVEELRAVIANEADVGVDADGFRARCRGLLERIPDPYWGTETETETSLTPQERVAVYLAEGVSWWVHNDLREMTDNSASRLTGIFQRSTYTYTTDDGSTITLNMGRDTKSWRQVAQKADESPSRTQKRAWLCAIREVLVEELRAVIANEADDVFKERCRELLGRIETSLTPQERVALYLAEGVSWWVHNEFRGMTNVAASQLTGISHRSTYTYTTEDGSTITLNMGQDIDMWKRVAKGADESPSRTQKRAWLCAIGEVLVEELRAVIANEADVGVDADGFRLRCRGLLERIPDPYWGERGDTAPPPL